MKINKFRVYDVLHKSVVTSLIAFSAAGTIWLGYKAINWFTGKFLLFSGEWLLLLTNSLIKTRQSHINFLAGVFFIQDHDYK